MCNAVVAADAAADDDDDDGVYTCICRIFYDSVLITQRAVTCSLNIHQEPFMSCSW